MDPKKLDLQYRNAVKTLEHQLFLEKRLPKLAQQLNIQLNELSASGMKDGDYPVVAESIRTNAKIAKTSNIPAILKEQIKNVKQNYTMNIFLDVDRLCVTVDSNLFFWNYEICGEPEIYNGITDAIVCVKLIKPRRGVFYHNINYLLIVCTLVEVFVVGVMVSGFNSDNIEFTREIIFNISTDTEEVRVIETIDGRIFLGTQHGKIIELAYWAETPNWITLPNKNCYTNTQYAYKTDWTVYMKYINHSAWIISMFLPNLIFSSISNTSAIIQIATDSTRGCFYTLSENSTITEYQLLPNNRLKQGNYITEACMVSKMLKVILPADKEQFKSVIHLAPLPVGYGLLKLVAITQSGMRLYFIEDMRMSHIRLPPVNCAALCSKMDFIRHCCESRGSFLLAPGSQGPQVLFLISPDQFINPGLTESVSLTWLQQTCLSLQPLDKTNSWKLAGPPIIQTQHIDPVRQFILLTTDNILVIELTSPIYQLKSLIERPMNTNSEFKIWINHYGLDETIYAALVLSRDVKKVNPTLSSKAVDLVIYYMSENVSLRLHNVTNCGFKYEIPNPLHNLLFLYAARIMRPMWDSCMIELVFNEDLEQEEQFETTHDFEQLIYYISHLVHLQSFIHDNYSRLKSFDLMAFPNTVYRGHIDQLDFMTPYGPDQSLSMPLVNSSNKSLTLELSELLKISIEIVGLWRLLTEHNFRRILEYVPPEIRRELLTTPIKHLLLSSKQHILLSLVSALLEYYLEDGSSTDRIIETLLQICPNIYRIEDAMCSKANELIVTIDTLNEPDLEQIQLDKKKNNILTEAISYYERVGPNLELGSVVCRLRSVGCVWGSVYLCMHVAKLRDPDEIAFLCLRECRRPQTKLEVAAVEGRNDAYRHMLECLSALNASCAEEQFNSNNGIDKMSLDLLNEPVINSFDQTNGLRNNPGDRLQYLENHTNALMPYSNSANSQVWCAPFPVRSDPWREMHIVLSSIFNKADIMAHYEVYSWMIDNNMTEEILKYSKSTDHLESYLQRCLDQLEKSLQDNRSHNDSQEFANEAINLRVPRPTYTSYDDAAVINMKTLLWKYYEKHKRYYDAAKILDSMAVTRNYALNLQERIECLSRAVVFVKAVNANQKPVDTNFLKQLEDKVEVVNLQKTIIDEAELDHPIECRELSSQLFSVYILLKEFVEPMDLSLSKLTILKMSDYEPSRTRLVWEDIISKEIYLAEEEYSRDRKMTRLRHAVIRLINGFKDEVRLIPLDVVIYHLEIYGNTKDFKEIWTADVLVYSGVPISNVIIAYGDIIKMKTVEIKKCANRIYSSICHLFDLFLNQDDLHSKCAGNGQQLQDVITSCLIQVQSKPDSLSRNLASKFSVYQSQIEIFSS